MTKSIQPPNNSEPLEGALRDAVRAIKASSPPTGFGKQILAEAASWRHSVAPKTYAPPASRSPLLGLIAASIAASIFFLWFTGNSNPRKVEVATGKKFQVDASGYAMKKANKPVDFDAVGQPSGDSLEQLAKSEHFSEGASRFDAGAVRQMNRDPQSTVRSKADDEARQLKLAELDATAAEADEKAPGDAESANFSEQRGSESFGQNALNKFNKQAEDEREAKPAAIGVEQPTARFSRAIAGEMTDLEAAGQELAEKDQLNESKASENKRNESMNVPQLARQDGLKEALKKESLQDMPATLEGGAKRSSTTPGATSGKVAGSAPGPGGSPLGDRGGPGGFGGRGSALPMRRGQPAESETTTDPSKEKNAPKNAKKDAIQDREETAGKREQAKSKGQSKIEVQEELRQEAEEPQSRDARTSSNENAMEVESKRLEGADADGKPGNAPRRKADAAPNNAPRDKSVDPSSESKPSSKADGLSASPRPASPKSVSPKPDSPVTGNPDVFRMRAPSEKTPSENTPSPAPPSEIPAALSDVTPQSPGANLGSATRKMEGREMESMPPKDAPSAFLRSTGRGAAPGVAPGSSGPPAESAGGAAGSSAGVGMLEGEAFSIVSKRKKSGEAPHRFFAISDNSTLLFTTGDTTPLELGQVVPESRANLLHVFDWAKPEKSRILTEIGPTVLTASPSGSTLLNANGVLFELPEKRVELLAALGDNIQSLAISPTGKEVITQHVDPAAPIDAYYRISDLPSGKERFVLPNPWSDTFTVGFAAQGDAFALIDKDRNIREYALSTGSEKKKLAPALPSEAVALEYSPNGKFLAAATTRGETLVYGVEIARLFQELKPETPPPGAAVDPISALRFSPDANFLAASNSQRLFFWNLATGEIAAQLAEGSGGAVYLRYAEDGKKITAIKGFTETQTEEGKPALKYPTVQEFEVPQAARMP